MTTAEVLHKLEHECQICDRQFPAAFENLGRKAWTNNIPAIQKARDRIDALYRRQNQITRAIDLIKEVISTK